MKLFDLIAPVYDFLRSEEIETFSHLKEVGDFKTSDRVLDIGGGTGKITKNFKGLVQEVIVVDLSPNMLKQAVVKYGLQTICADVSNLPLSNDSVDKILLVDAFHHFPNQTDALKEIKRVLKPGGSVVFEEYNPQTFGGFVVVILESILRFGSTFYTPANVKTLLEKEGFKVKVLDLNRKQYYVLAQK